MQRDGRRAAIGPCFPERRQHVLNHPSWNRSADGDESALPGGKHQPQGWLQPIENPTRGKDSAFHRPLTVNSHCVLGPLNTQAALLRRSSLAMKDAPFLRPSHGASTARRRSGWSRFPTSREADGAD
jgi:hypothetical protein